MKLFLLIAMIAVVYAGGTATKCNNPFLDDLRKLNVTIGYQARSSKCRGEWSKYGSCCNEVQLETMFKTEAEKTLNESKRLGVLVNDIKTQLNLLVKAVKANPPKISTENVEYLLKETQNFLDQKIFTLLSETSQKCWAKMNEVRGSALCSICSGRSSVYFNSNKVLVDVSDCKAVLATCKDFYLDLSAFFKKLSNLVDGLEALKLVDDAKAFNDLHQSIKSLSLPLELENEFKTFHNSRDKAEVDKSAGKICNGILRIRQTPFVQQVNTVIKKSILGGGVALVKSVLNVAFKVLLAPLKILNIFGRKLNLESPLSNWGDRRLQNNEDQLKQNANNFESDSQTYFKNSDNMFSGGQQNSEYQPQPMNMSMVFP